jgi:leader peptidase (prepilin peptidase) / N-methyltransferase
MLLSNILQMVPALTLFGLAIPLARTDIRERRLPNKFTLSLLMISATSLLLASFLIGKFERFFLVIAIALMILVFGYGLSWLNLMGYGDIKLISGMSMSLTWFEPLLLMAAMTIAFGLAAIAGTIAVIRKRMTLRGSLALGPYLLVGFGLSSLVPLSQLVPRVIEAASS